MKKRRSLLHHKLQTGALGVFVCVVLVIVFGLISLQNITTTSLDLYLSNSKQHIEEARQLAYAGLRHYTHNFGNDEAIQQLIDSHQGDTRVIGESPTQLIYPKHSTRKYSWPAQTRRSTRARTL